jgi:DNA-binding transcriptional regulator GbsR (MarR family)
MTDEQHAFIEDMGQHMAGWGQPRNTGRIYAYLLLQGGPAGLDQIASDLGVGKSGVSVGTRQLVQIGLARGIGERGSRRLLYEALYSVEAIMAARNSQARDLLSLLEQASRLSPDGPGRRELHDMAGMLQDFMDRAPEVFRQMREQRRRK